MKAMMRPILIVAALFSASIVSVTALGISSSRSPGKKEYKYLAFGSNLNRGTMESLRGIEPIGATAAVLPGYRLRFNLPGVPFLEPSAATVEKCPNGSSVHGVLYTLTEQDFATVGSTEGVPFSYQWESCWVVPYVGDGLDAGAKATEGARIDNTNEPASVASASSVESSTTRRLRAYTLVSSSSFSRPDLPPSKSYLSLIIGGAKEWRFDKDYVDALEATPYARNLLIPDGLAKTTLDVAQMRRKLSNR